MIRINLGKESIQKGPLKVGKGALSVEIPPGVVQQVKKLTGNVGVVITFAVAVGVAGLLPLITGQIISSLVQKNQEEVKVLQTKIANLNSEVQKFTPFQKELQSYEEQKKVVSNRLAAVRELLDQRGAPVNVLDSIGQSLPTRTWINEVSFSFVEPNATLAMTGSSYSNEEISDLIDKLNESIYLSEVSLEEVGTRTEDKTEYRTFNVTAKPKSKVLASAPRSVAMDVSPPAAKPPDGKK